MPYTITGMTLTDTDSAAVDGTGLYAAMSTYSFPGFGSFTTDASTGEFYAQGCFNATAFGCVGLTDLRFNTGFTGFPPAIIPIDPDLGGVPLG